MNNYNNDGNKFRKPQGGQRSDHRGSERRSSDRPRFNSQNSGPTQMHDAICADCGGNCKVPFIPSSGKPVYCSNCFEKRGNGDNNSRRPNFSPNKRSFSPPAPRPHENYNKQFEIINSKLDKIFKLLNSRNQESNGTKEAKIVADKVITEQPTPKIIELPSEDLVEKIAEKVAPVKVVKKKAKAKKAPKAEVSESSESID